MQQIKNIGFIGTGVMGKSMASHLISKGHSLQVFNRTQSKADDLVKQGALFQTPQQIAQQCELVFLMLGYPKDVEEMMIGQNGILNIMQKQSIVIDHTTSSPDLAKKIYEEGLKKEVHVLDIPVSGGDTGAKNGKLVCMAGGDQNVYDKALPYLMSYSDKCQLLGQAGSGQHTKCANQIMVANNLIGLCEALIYSAKSGLDEQKVVNLLNGGAATSFALQNLAPRILVRDFEPGFYVQHFVKDLGIVLNECKKMNLNLRGVELAYQIYEDLMKDNGQNLGTQAIITTVEKINKVQVKNYK